MSNAVSIEEMVAVDAVALQAGGHPRQQRRHPARRAARIVSDAEVGRDPRDQPLLGLPHDAAGAAVDARQQMGPHHQRRLGARPRRLAVQVGLCRRQARHGRADQGHRARDRRGRHHLQRHLPRLRLHAAGRGADRATRRRRTTSRASRSSGTCCSSTSRTSASPRSRRWRRSLCSWRATAPPRSPAQRIPSMAAGPRTDQRERREERQ